MQEEHGKKNIAIFSKSKKSNLDFTQQKCLVPSSALDGQNFDKNYFFERPEVWGYEI